MEVGREGLDLGLQEIQEALEVDKMHLIQEVDLHQEETQSGHKVVQQDQDLEEILRVLEILSDQGEAHKVLVVPMDPLVGMGMEGLATLVIVAMVMVDLVILVQLKPMELHKLGMKEEEETQETLNMKLLMKMNIRLNWMSYT